jgi:hypothetical protein
MFTITSTLEQHFSTLLQHNTTQENGILIGDKYNILAFLPISRTENFTTTAIHQLENTLVGGLHIAGLYTFTTSNDDQLSRLTNLATTYPNRSPWLLLLNAASKLSHVAMAPMSTTATPTPTPTPTPTSIRFQPKLEREYQQFTTNISIVARAASPTGLEASVRSVLDKRRALLTIDSSVVPRSYLATLTVSQIPKQSNSTHSVSIQMVHTGATASKVPEGAVLALSPTVIMNTFDCISFVHRSSKLLAIVETLIDHVVRQCNHHVEKMSTDKSYWLGTEYWSVYNNQCIEQAQTAQYITKHRFIPSSNTATGTWASLQPALNAVASNRKGEPSNIETKIKSSGSSTNNGRKNPATATKEPVPLVKNHNAVLSNKRDERTTTTTTTTTTQATSASTTSPAVVVLVVGVVLVAIALKFAL